MQSNPWVAYIKGVRESGRADLEECVVFAEQQIPIWEEQQKVHKRYEEFCKAHAV